MRQVDRRVEDQACVERRAGKIDDAEGGCAVGHEVTMAKRVMGDAGGVQAGYLECHFVLILIRLAYAFAVLQKHTRKLLSEIMSNKVPITFRNNRPLQMFKFIRIKRRFARQLVDFIGAACPFDEDGFAGAGEVVWSGEGWGVGVRACGYGE